MTKLQRTALNSAENTCLCAVEYVGYANYREREAQARKDVEQAFQTLRRVFEKDGPFEMVER